MAADRFRRPFGLRLRITAVAVLTVGTALAVSAVLLIGLLRSRLDTAVTTTATLRAHDVAALAAAGALPRTLALPGEDSAFVQVVDESGAVIGATGNIEGEPAISTVRPAGPEPLALTIPKRSPGSTPQSNSNVGLLPTPVMNCAVRSLRCEQTSRSPSPILIRPTGTMSRTTSSVTSNGSNISPTIYWFSPASIPTTNGHTSESTSRRS